MRYVVTGGSGYIGSRLVDRLVERDETERVLICDVRPPARFRPKAEYRQLDVRDRAAVTETVTRERPDTLVHLAFVLNPIRDEHAMYDIDVNGTQNVLEAASKAETEHVLVTSSATAYGAYPDNPVPLTEDHPVRGVPDFEYARDKADCDRLCQLWGLRHPDHTTTIVRPCIVFGPSVDNYSVRLWTRQPFQADFGGPDVPIQFLHEDDLVEALDGLLEGRHAGAFNVAPDDDIPIRQCADLIGLRRRRIPLRVYWAIGAVAWRVRLSETPPGNLHFAIHPWVISNRKIKETLGWEPRHSSRETFEITMRARGALGPEAPKGVPEIGAPVGV